MTTGRVVLSDADSLRLAIKLFPLETSWSKLRHDGLRGMYKGELVWVLPGNWPRIEAVRFSGSLVRFKLKNVSRHLVECGDTDKAIESVWWTPGSGEWLVTLSDKYEP